MAQLDDIKAGSYVKGLAGDEVCEILNVKYHGNALSVTFQNSKGKLGQQLVLAEYARRIQILQDSLPWSFDADGDRMRLVSEAYRIHLAHLFDPYLAVHTSEVEPLPHQISAVYQEMLPRTPLRYVLADDPGAGKTIMTGLFLKELLIRGDLKNCLIVSPGNLVEQWQDELFQKFHLRFEILTNDRIESSATGNIFTEMPYCIARLDKLSRDENVQNKLKVTEWDLIVVDEAHKMSATVWGGEVKYTKRFQLGRLLSGITKNFLLLTATPHNGKEEDFQLFMSLIDQDRFERSHNTITPDDVSDVMRRLVKEELLKFDGTPLFPERRAYTVNYDLSPDEKRLYDEVTEYVRDEFNRAENLKKERKNTVGFALTVLQRRLASSPEAIYQSLRRRRERLEAKLEDTRNGKITDDEYIRYDFGDDFDEDDIANDDLENMEEDVVDQASAAQTIHEMEEEIATLKRLEGMANTVRRSGRDRKWEELSGLLQEQELMFDKGGQREKLIIFTENKDTLNYITTKIRTLLGSQDAVVNIHGGMHREDRRTVEELFRQDKDVRVLVATDAAGEGINLQRAHLMINYDLPWNPNRLEQRFGRIHRIGQTEVCHLWNLVAKETREGMVFQRLFEKLEEERTALGGKVYDILGKMTFDNKPLKDLLLEAIRYGEREDVRERLNKAVDNSMDQERLRELLEERAFTDDSMDISKVTAIREEMDLIEAHKLQPHYIASFFIEAFRNLGGKIRPREKGRYEITFVPSTVRNLDFVKGYGKTILEKYERVCFDKEYCNVFGEMTAQLICPGHPLLDAVIKITWDKNNDVMKRGAIFVDENDFGKAPRLLFYIEDSIQNGVPEGSGRRIISKNMHFVEMNEHGEAKDAGYAPYLDYRAATLDERSAVRKYIDTQKWLTKDVENKAEEYAVSTIIPEHFEEVRSHQVDRLQKLEKAVQSRLTQEIQYWDAKAAELKEKEKSGKGNPKLNSDNCMRRADDLDARRKRRIAEIEKEKDISPLSPVITGGALIIPKGLMHELMHEPDTPDFGGANKQSMEYAAMNAVMNIEKSLGFVPKDVSGIKCGYDIKSEIPKDKREGTSALRLIEVKGRQKGADTVTVSKNEILTSFNKPDDFILAIVEVDGDMTHTIYLKHPFKERPEFTATSVNFDIVDLVNNSERILER